MEWVKVSDEAPLWGQDVLVYSASMRGYAVAQAKPAGVSDLAWINSTTGQPFPPHSVTHWMKLPPPPSEEESDFTGWSGYSGANN